MKNELQVVQKTNQLKAADEQAMGLVQKLELASDTGTRVAEIIEEKGLSRSFGGGKPHVYVEAMDILAALLGYTATEDEEIKTPDGYEVWVKLTHPDGKTSRAKSMCERSEPNWAKKHNHAIRSMAATRARGRAYKPQLGWILALAGYETASVEEMMGIDDAPAPAPVIDEDPFSPTDSVSPFDGHTDEFIELRMLMKEGCHNQADLHQAGQAAKKAEGVMTKAETEELRELYIQRFQQLPA